MSAESQLTPMMAQYRRIKGRIAEGRAYCCSGLGDFADEMFFRRTRVAGVAVAECGVDEAGHDSDVRDSRFHAANSYMARLLRAGRKVAICDQVEVRRGRVKLVKREVTQILRPGNAFLDERMLTAERNNYLAAVYAPGKKFRAGAGGLDDRGVSNARNWRARRRCWRSWSGCVRREIIAPSEDAVVQALLKGSFPIARTVYWTTGCSPRRRRSSRCGSISSCGVAGRLRAEEQGGGGGRGGRGAACTTDAAFAAGRGAFDVAFVLRDVGFSGAGLITTLRHLEILEPLHRDAARTATLCTGR